MPVRKIPPKQKSLSGICAGNGKEGIAFESSLERDFITLMLFDDRLISIEEQPMEVLVPGKVGRASYYVPDFLVNRRDLPTMLIEVKPSAILAEEYERFAARFEAAQNFAEARGWTFSIWTEKEIYGDRLENGKFLLPFRSQDFDETIARSVIDYVDHQGGPLKLSELANCNGDTLTVKGMTIHTIWCLLASGRLIANFDKEITMESQVELPNDAGGSWAH